MRDCQDNGLIAHCVECYDDYEVWLRLDDLLNYSSRVGLAVSSVLHVLDVDEMEERSYSRKAWLGRYGRQSVVQWDNVPVTEIAKHAKALNDLMKREAATTRMHEDD